MNNEQIAFFFKKTAEMLELHGENPFKVKSYAGAAFNIDKMNTALATLPPDELASVEGLGKSMVKHVQELLEKGTFEEFETLKAKTPEGVFEMLDIKGIGPKKVAALWHELGIENKEALKKACEENKVAQLKGFGEKTQETILKNLNFEDENQGNLRIDDAWAFAHALLNLLEKHFEQIEIVGQTARYMDLVDCLEFLAVGMADETTISKLQSIEGFEYRPQESHPFLLSFGIDLGKKLNVKVHFCPQQTFEAHKILLTATDNHLLHKKEDNTSFFHYLKSSKKQFNTEQEAYQAFGHSFISPEMRETSMEWDVEAMKNVVEEKDIRGVFHNHSTYSDGKNSLEEMFKACLDKGWNFFGIADHSVSAKTYAGGLDEDEIVKQHQEIDTIQKRYPQGKFFKGIESDILGDGSLDYTDSVLKTFDYVVASVHSGLKMDETKAMARLIKAIENPYTSILGHMTGRLVAKRAGYPVNHKKIIDACAANGVVIELNSSPWRLDIDWRELDYCIEKGVIIALNPDAHETAGLDDTFYGLKLARKAMLPRELCLNTYSVEAIEKVFGKTLLNITKRRLS